MEDLPRYFCISFHKTGTRSFHELMQVSGKSSFHSPGSEREHEFFSLRKNPKCVLSKLESIIAEVTIHSDVPWPGLFREVAAKYPAAKFVLIRRDPAKWFESLSKHWSWPLLKRRLTPFEAIQYWPYLGDEIDRLFTRRDRNLFIDAFIRHEHAVQRELPPERLLVLGLGDSDAARKIASFVNLPEVHSFPHVGMQTKVFRFSQYRRNLRLRYQARS
jgi:hypothetical protein